MPFHIWHIFYVISYCCWWYCMDHMSNFVQCSLLVGAVIEYEKPCFGAAVLTSIRCPWNSPYKTFQTTLLYWWPTFLCHYWLESCLVFWNTEINVYILGTSINILSYFLAGNSALVVCSFSYHWYFFIISTYHGIYILCSIYFCASGVLFIPLVIQVIPFSWLLFLTSTAFIFLKLFSKGYRVTVYILRI